MDTTLVNLADLGLEEPQAEPTPEELQAAEQAKELEEAWIELERMFWVEMRRAAMSFHAMAKVVQAYQSKGLPVELHSAIAELRRRLDG